MLTNPTLDQMQTLGLAGMAAAYWSMAAPNLAADGYGIGDGLIYCPGLPSRALDDNGGVVVTIIGDKSNTSDHLSSLERSSASDRQDAPIFLWITSCFSWRSSVRDTRNFAR